MRTLLMILALMTATHSLCQTKKNNLFAEGSKIMETMNFKDAIPYFTNAINQDNSCYDCYFNRALCRQMCGLDKDAIRDYNFYIDHVSDKCLYYAAYAGRARSEAKESNYQSAISDIIIAIENCVECSGCATRIVGYFLEKGDFYMGLLSFDMAITEYTKIYENDAVEAYMRAEACNRLSNLYASTYKHEPDYEKAQFFKKKYSELRQ